jgi:(1->4)-alpha-D-glucan 1-alpha-D-glucosylmutase
LNSLTQVALKVTLPGVPDFYQGTEFWDLSFADPDNRRQVDFPVRQAALRDVSQNWQELIRTWTDGRIKLALTRRLLDFRSRLTDVFAQGDCRQLSVTGPDRDEVIAYVRSSDRDAAIVVAGRHMARASEGGHRWPAGRAWRASIAVEEFSSLRNVFTSAAIRSASKLDLAELFDIMPVAVLQAERVISGQTD